MIQKRGVAVELSPLGEELHMKKEEAAPQQGAKPKVKTLIGVLASHDSPNGKNKELAELFVELYQGDRHKLGEFHFLFTGGTYDRIILGIGRNAFPIPDQTVRDFVKMNSTRLPAFGEGGVTVLANFVVQRQCGIVWAFIDPFTGHWLNPENLALFRLCDIWKAKRLMNSGSVRVWFHYEADKDVNRYPQTIPQDLLFGGGDFVPAFTSLTSHVDGDWVNQWSGGVDRRKAEELFKGWCLGYWVPPPKPKKRTLDFWDEFDKQTIALIAHDAMKERMVDFAVEYERELAQFARILATGTTGQEVINATRLLSRPNLVRRCRSGPKGGDIEIATEVLYGRCDIVVFFIDPLKHAHPHIEDIRTVFSACMREGETLMLTNEVQAREWMDRVFRG